MKDTRRYTRNWYQAEPAPEPDLMDAIGAAASIIGMVVLLGILMYGGTLLLWLIAGGPS